MNNKIPYTADRFPELQRIFSQAGSNGGSIPARLKRFAKAMGKGIERFSMFNSEDTVMLGISGGKDSLALALGLALRRIMYKSPQKMIGTMIEWTEYPLAEEKRSALEDYFKLLDIPFHIIPHSMYDGIEGKFSCYRCSRRRRSLLFDAMKKYNSRHMAFGHHMDDLIQTTLMNMINQGVYSTMMPVQEFFEDPVYYIIRPMVEIKESWIKSLAADFKLPVTKNPCPFEQTNQRAVIKPVIESLEQINPLAREHLYKASWQIKHHYLPFSLMENKN